MILEAPLDLNSMQRYYDTLPVDNPFGTVMSRLVPKGVKQRGVLTVENPKLDSPANVGLGTMEDTLPQSFGNPQSATYTDYLIGTPDASVTPILLTDKAGTYAQPTMASLQRGQIPIDATLLNNPAVEGLSTLQFASPMLANYQDQPGSVNGSDPIGALVNLPPASAPPDSTETDNENIATGIPGFTIKKSVLKETGIFLVGAAILIAGIFALTR